MTEKVGQEKHWGLHSLLKVPFYFVTVGQSQLLPEKVPKGLPNPHIHWAAQLRPKVESTGRQPWDSPA